MRRLGPRPILLGRSLVHRLRRRRALRGLRFHYQERVGAVPAGASLRCPTVDFPPEYELPAALAPAARRLLLEAEAVLEHRVDYLGSGPTFLGDQIDWHRDFRSGCSWPAVFYQDVEVTRLDDSSDAKVPWELSRGHQLLTLARAARLWEDVRFADEFEAQLSSWLEANPPGVGINWVNAMETGLRAVNWIWALGTIEPFRPLQPPLRAAVIRSLQAHGRHIESNLEASPHLRSNHYLSDLLGLLAVGAAIEGDPAAQRWFRFAHKELEREIVGQVNPDGTGFEASTSYHGLCLEIFLLAHVLAARGGHPFSAPYVERLRSMLRVSRTLRHPNGRIPQFGDSDSGRVLPGGFDRPPTHDPLLWLGAAELGEERPLEGPASEEVAWVLGVEAWRRVGQLAEPARPESTAFTAGGLYSLRVGEALAVLRCGGVGQGGNGGHAHNDALSFELSWAEPLIVDSGTFAYTGNPEARNAFRSTSAHNTVVVDGEEQNPIVATELFRLHGLARPSLERWLRKPDRVEVVASHDGYRRLAGRVIHRRTLELTAGGLAVADKLLGAGVHRAESFLHLAPGTEVRDAGAQRLEVRLGEAAFALEWEGFDEVEIGEGWISDRYGVRERAPVVVARLERQLPACFGFRLAPAAARARAAEPAAVGSAA